jgi:hypothetical protein
MREIIENSLTLIMTESLTGGADVTAHTLPPLRVALTPASMCMTAYTVPSSDVAQAFCSPGMNGLSWHPRNVSPTTSAEPNVMSNMARVSCKRPKGSFSMTSTSDVMLPTRATASSWKKKPGGGVPRVKLLSHPLWYLKISPLRTSHAE